MGTEAARDYSGNPIAPQSMVRVQILFLSLKAYGKIDWHVGYRLGNHFQHHHSQRPYQLPEEQSYYDHLQRLGLEFLRLSSRDSR